MRILVLNWKHPGDSAAGGAEKYVARVVAAWASRGHEVSLFVPRPSPRTVGHEDFLPGVRLVVRGTRATVFRQSRRYLWAHRDEFDGVLESVSTRPFFTHELVGDRALVLYHQIADDVWDQEFPFPMSWIGRRMVEPHWLRRITGARVVANSQSTARDLAARGVSSVAIVPPGADPVPEAGLHSLGVSPRVVFVGRLVRTKRPHDAIRAFAGVRARYPAATLDVIGDGYLRDSLRRLRAPGVTVHGFVPDGIKVKLLARADLLLLPGTREGWGIVAIEAALHGVPVVAYNVPGLRDAVVDGSTGMLTSPDPMALGAAAVDLLSDQPRWARQAAAARRRAVFYTWGRAADELLKLLSSVATEGARRSAA
jgi:glycosyltransferase involved in cell wall biosynthesis